MYALFDATVTPRELLLLTRYDYDAAFAVSFRFADDPRLAGDDDETALAFLARIEALGLIAVTPHHPDIPTSYGDDACTILTPAVRARWVADLRRVERGLLDGGRASVAVAWRWVGILTPSPIGEWGTLADRDDAGARVCCLGCRTEHLALAPCAFCGTCALCGADYRDCRCHLADTDSVPILDGSPAAEAFLEAEWERQVGATVAALVLRGVVPALARELAERDLRTAEYGDIPPC